MFSRTKTESTIDKEQMELFEQAKARIKQKKRLFQHFIFFVVGSLFLIIANIFLGIGKDVQIFEMDWFVIAIVIWAFLFVVHFCRVWLVHTFMGAKWEAKQMENLVEKQRKKIVELQQRVDQEHPLPNNSIDPSLPTTPGSEDEKLPLL